MSGRSTAKRSRISEEDDVVPYANIIKGDKRISLLRSRQIDEIKVHINLTDDSIREGDKCTNRKADAKMQSGSSDKFINTTAKKHLKDVKMNKTNFSIHQRGDHPNMRRSSQVCLKPEIKIDKQKLSFLALRMTR